MGITSTQDSSPSTYDRLLPPFDSNERQSSLTVATFNLVATIVGGGVLSLPMAFSRLGVIPSTFLMLVGALLTDKSLYLLCLAARRTAATSYGELGYSAFGDAMDTAVSALLFIFLLFVITGYMVLLADVWTPIVGILMATKARSHVVLLALVVLIIPFVVQHTLHALRFNCYIGFASISLLTLEVAFKAVIAISTRDDFDLADLKLWPTSVGDVLFALPIMSLAYVSQFNVLTIQNALIQPSRPRMQCVITTAVSLCFALMYLMGLAGYAYAGENVHGNILLNCDPTDLVFFTGRVGCGITILLALPVMTLPCRKSFLEVADVLYLHSRNGNMWACNSVQHPEQQRRQLSAFATNSDEEKTLLLPEKDCPCVSTAPRSGSCGRSTESIHHHESNILKSAVWHYGSTLGIVAACYCAAVAVPGVAVVWSLCGSSMAFAIAYTLPAAFFVKLEQIERANLAVWTWWAWFLIVLSIVLAVVCTGQTVFYML